MKKITLFVVTLAALMSVRVHAQSVQITLDVGQLLNSSTGSTPMSDGYLLQVISDSSDDPGAPTASSFTGTDPNEVVLTSTTMNSSNAGGIPGDTAINVTFNLATSGSTGYLFLRWYPDLLPSATSPGAGAIYGQFSSNTIEYPSDDSSIAWEIPPAGNNYDMYFLTQSQDDLGPGTPNDPPANSAGYASSQIAAVPEPGILTMLAVPMATGIMFLRRRRRRS